MHTVYINDHPLHIVDAYEVDDWKGTTDCIFVAEQEMSVHDVLTELEETKNHPGFIYLAANPDVAWQIFISYCTLIEAAGGLVQNEKKETLIIFRKGRYDLPKGKLDYGETPSQCALREVEEECGVKGLELIEPLIKTFHIYSEGKKRKLKKTHWFFMHAKSQQLVPQTEEQIERAEWMNSSKIRKEVLSHTYGSIAAVLQKYLET